MIYLVDFLYFYNLLYTVYPSSILIQCFSSIPIQWISACTWAPGIQAVPNLSGAWERKRVCAGAESIGHNEKGDIT